MRSDPAHNDFVPQAVLEFSQTGDGAGTVCALLTPAIKAKLRELDSGQVLEVRVDDPTAGDDILSWSRLSGNAVLAMFADQPGRLRVYLQKK
jgi:TusA-related sulfurtransferase